MIMFCMMYVLQADFVKLDNGYAFLSFGIVLFVWEVLPMFIVIILFRVRKPGSTTVSNPTIYNFCHRYT